MKTIVGSVVVAVGASTCCLGPVMLSALGAGALGAISAKLAVLRPLFLVATAALPAGAFYLSYRQTSSEPCGPDGSCAPRSKRTAIVVLWLATIVVILLVTFPYYVNWLV